MLSGMPSRNPSHRPSQGCQAIATNRLGRSASASLDLASSLRVIRGHPAQEQAKSRKAPVVGPFRKSRDVRVESEMNRIADID